MSKAYCECGFLMSNSIDPNDVQVRVYRKEEWKNARDEEYDIDPRFGVATIDPVADFWRCPKCQRLYLFDYSYKAGAFFSPQELTHVSPQMLLDIGFRKLEENYLHFYTDKELYDIETAGVYYMSQEDIPMPPRDAWISEDGQYLYIEEKEVDQQQLYMLKTDPRGVVKFWMKTVA